MSRSHSTEERIKVTLEEQNCESKLKTRWKHVVAAVNLFAFGLYNR